jgi:hypothetical protein
MLALLFTLFSVCPIARAADGEVKLPPKENFHLFLLVGQSNMAGRGLVEEQDRQPNPRVLMLTKENRWVPAVDPLHFDKSVAGVGLGRTFGIEIAKANPAITVGLIPAAHGGSPISAWQPGIYYEPTKGYPWDDAIERTNEALKAGVLKGILWHQGESDSKPETAEVYEAQLHDLVSRFRKEFASPNLPFIVGQLGQFDERPWDASRKLVDAAHQGLPKQVAHTAFVDSNGLSHKGDEVHFDSKSYRELGHRYAKAFQELSQ